MASVYCSDCAYDMHAAKGRKCPECGSACLVSVVRGRVFQAWALGAPAFVFIVATVLPYFEVGLLWRSRHPFPAWIALAGMIMNGGPWAHAWTAFVPCSVFALAYGRSPRRLLRMRGRWYVVFAVLVGLNLCYVVAGSWAFALYQSSGYLVLAIFYATIPPFAILLVGERIGRRNPELEDFGMAARSLGFVWLMLFAFPYVGEVL